jgi:arsenate reductase
VTTTTLYGIANCDRVKSARAWLEGRALAYRFHDFRRDGLSRDLLEPWCDAADWTRLLNRQGTTWRKLGPEAAVRAQDRASATALMLEYPALIRRPLLRHGPDLVIGFDPERYEVLFAS